MDFTALRREFPIFEYNDFFIEQQDQDLVIRFRFHVPPSLSFSPEIRFVNVPESWKEADQDALRNAVFHLGLIESLSYWKATCSPVIRVRAGSLTQNQVDWWKDLLIHGMGEFFFRNDIDFTADDIIQIQAPVPEDVQDLCYSGSLLDKTLVTLGGGRDSAFTAQVFKNSGIAFNCMVLNPTVASEEIARHAGCDAPVVIRRTIAHELLDLNARGFLNGHTPFSAYLAFLNTVCLIVYGYSRVVVANERSSDEGNVVYRNTWINHQYSKSLPFESLFDDYLQEYLLKQARYVSFVRPLYELQIARGFSQFPELFPIFKSCNRNQKQNSWCGECPKCLSVYITMFPFVPVDDMIRIFGADLFERQKSTQIIAQLAGMEDTKPFECVGTTEEIIAALFLSVEKVLESTEVLPPALRYANESILPLHPGARDSVSKILSSYGPHRLPSDFEALLKSNIVHTVT